MGARFAWRRRLIVLGLAWAGLGLLSSEAQAERPDPGPPELTRIATLDEPTTVATAPGPSSRHLLFVTEQAGTVRVIANGEKQEKPFLDITDRVEYGDTEQGLLSLAFDPDYEDNGRFYVYYTGENGAIEISRFHRQRKDPLAADPDSERTVLEIPHTASKNHNGGDLHFGPDGNLWISTGDGHPGCDPPENAQNTDVLLGKLLRISPGHGSYTVPPDNPFVGAPGADEVYAYGLRNPWRYSIDEQSGRIAIGDVGQFTTEEIDIVSIEDARGANFGWDAYEGYEPLVISEPCAGDTPTPLPPDPIFPVTTFPHASEDPEAYTGCAVIGGVIVRDRRLTGLRGRYLYNDHCNGRLLSLDPKEADPPVAVSDVGLRVRWPTSIVTGRKDRIYMTSRTGPLFRLDPAS